MKSKSQKKRKSTAWLSHPEEHRNTQARSGELESMMTFMLSVLSQREKDSRLPQLTPEKAADLYEDFLKGNLADVQLCWQQMEDYDPTLSTCLNARQSALAEMSWRIEPDEAMITDPAAACGSGEASALARQQTALLTSRLRAVDNLEDALVHLGMADFRGVAALEITGNEKRQKWCVIEPWNLVRPLRRGPWYFNQNADPVCPFPEILLDERVIIREARPLDLAAMFLVMSKTHALQGWDGFLDIYGLPSIFAELPPSIPEERRAEFDAVVRRIVGDGRGTVPAGTKFQTVETTKDNAQAFEQRAKWCDDAIIKLVLGGLLTVEAESGSGTLAGNAHSDSFDRLCAASARSISRAVDTQYCRRILKAAFPDQPILVHFVFGDEEQEDREAVATMLATLATAGYRAEDTVASDLLGIEITSANMDSTAIYAARAAGYVPTQAAMQQRMGMPLKPAPAAEGSGVASPPMVANRAAAEGSRLRAEGATPRQAGVASRAPEPQPDSAPLSAEELEAINALAKGGLNQEQIAQDAATAANALAEAVQGDGKVVANTAEDGDECENHKKGKPCRIHDKRPEEWVPIQEPDRISPDEARRLLEEGQEESDPLEHAVKLDTRMVAHWKEAGKSEEDIQQRLSQLPLMRELVKHPAEIWEDEETGRLTYLASAIGRDGKKYIVGFTPGGEDDYLETFWPGSRSLGSKRKGKKIYPETADAPST